MNYTNGDIVRHNVRPVDGLFRSELAGTGETMAVEGVENVESGQTYRFYCSLHPGMKGQLIVREDEGGETCHSQRRPNRGPLPSTSRCSLWGAP